MTDKSEIISEYERLESEADPMRGPDHQSIEEKVAYSCNTYVANVRQIMAAHTAKYMGAG